MPRAKLDKKLVLWKDESIKPYQNISYHISYIQLSLIDDGRGYEKVIWSKDLWPFWVPSNLDPGPVVVQNAATEGIGWSCWSCRSAVEETSDHCHVGHPCHRPVGCTLICEKRFDLALTKHSKYMGWDEMRCAWNLWCLMLDTCFVCIVHILLKVQAGWCWSYFCRRLTAELVPSAFLLQMLLMCRIIIVTSF